MLIVQQIVLADTLTAATIWACGWFSEATPKLR